ncbi:Calmodulin-binding receptor-like cytoplasmic kinase [Actinidia chinensis var. chinensis]|uniref:non-specific serine/threonine protein kinase n=1 Tax=Actinidia chinensis var. chinensis TaxID=1590841 RepID=A0A2R6QJ73_ACTCC|nr:Calmodulin-binding receptor-like cytoplasmic kinase [Actinidia chinensis var. chinensis]
MKNPPTTAKTHHRKTQKSAFSHITAAAKRVAGAFSLLLFWKKKSNSNEPKLDTDRVHGQVIASSSSIDNSTGSSSRTQSRFNDSDSYGPSKATSLQAGAVAFSIEEIFKATDNFSSANIIGEGGFGTVYKGKLKDGSLVAIKRARKDIYDKHMFTQFKNEILTLSKIEHLNLVRLFGYLEHGDERIIIVEYVANGTVREHLDGTRGNELEIAERLDIAIDVAHAVTYLHMYTDPPIIHRDVKASNILITEKLRAKVADFGLARIAAEDPGVTHISTQVKGTAGYLDPEYLKTYQLTPKSDVYSFGVLLVELITGRHPLEPKRPLKEKVTVKWALQRLKLGDAVVAMDPRLRRSPASIMVVEKVLKLARQCLAPQRQSRPSMKKCGEILWRIRKDFRDKNLSHAASASHYSENIDVRMFNRNMFGIEDSENYRFRSA